MTPSVEDWAEKVLPAPPRPAAERAIAIGDWPDGHVSHEVLLEGVCEPEQQWVIRARRPPGS